MEELRAFIEDAINLNSAKDLKSHSKKIIATIRQILNDPDAMHRSKLYNYRNAKKVPQSLLEGAALGLIFSEKEPISTGSSFYEQSFNENYKYSGLYFDSIHYSCHLSASTDNNKKLDSNIIIKYRGVHLHPYYEVNNMTIQGTIDLPSADDMAESFKHSGRGIRLDPRERRIVTTKDEKGSSSKSIFSEQKIIFDSSSDHLTSLTYQLTSKNTYDVYPENNEFQYEKSLFTLRRPVKKLIMEIHFDPSIFDQHKTFSVLPVCFPGHLRIENNRHFIDDMRSSLDNQTLHKVGSRSWKLESILPPLSGMKYGFIYNLNDTNDCLKDKIR